MYNETQLAALKLFGRKDLTFGCLMLTPAGICPYITSDSIESDNTRRIFLSNTVGQISGNRCIDDNDSRDCKILGHESHLEDLFRVAEEKGNVIEFNKMADGYYLFYHKAHDEGFHGPELIKISPSLPLLSQPHLSEIVNLFSK